MKLDVTQILSGKLTKMPFSYSFSPDTAYLPTEGVILPADVQIPADGITVTGEVRSVGGYILLDAHVDVVYTTPCSRCLDEIRAQMSFELSRTIRSGESAVRFSDAEEEWDGVLEDVLYLTEGAVCPDGDILEQIVLELPMVQVCSDDCLGLCPYCGRKIAEGCDCAAKEAEKAKKEIDPRLAKLQKLLEKPDEV